VALAGRQPTNFNFLPDVMKEYHAANPEVAAAATPVVLGSKSVKERRIGKSRSRLRAT
jgi:hypothetical protein